MASTVEGVFLLIDRASGVLENIERQARKTDAALRGTADTMDKIGTPRQVRNIERTERQMQNLDRSFQKTDRSGGILQSRLVQIGAKLAGLARIIQVLKFPAMIAGVGLAAQGVGALAGGVTGLVSVMGDLSAVAAALPATMIGIGGAAITAKLALGGVGEALGGNREAMKRLNPEAKEFVKTLRQYKPVVQELRSAAQRGLFPGLTGALGTLQRGRPVARRALGRFGRTLGGGAEQAAGAFTSPRALGDIDTLLRQGDRILGRMIRGAINLGQAIRHIAVAAAPFTDWLTKTVLGWTRVVRQVSQAGRESGRLNDFFERARQTTKATFDILGNLWNTLRGIARAARPLGETLFYAFHRATERWEEFTNSARGQRRMRAWFNAMRAPLMEFFGLIGDVAKAWASLTEAGGGVNGPLARSLRVARGYADDLAKALGGASETMGPSFVMVLGEVVRLFANLPWSPIKIILDALAGVLDVVNDLIERVPILGTVIATALTAFSLNKMLGFFSLLTGGWRRATAEAVTYRAAAAGATVPPGATVPGGPGGFIGPTQPGRFGRALSRAGARGGMVGGLARGAGRIGGAAGRFGGPLAMIGGTAAIVGGGAIGGRAGGALAGAGTGAGVGALAGSVIPGVGTAIGAGAGAAIGGILGAVTSGTEKSTEALDKFRVSADAALSQSTLGQDTQRLDRLGKRARRLAEEFPEAGRELEKFANIAERRSERIREKWDTNLLQFGVGLARQKGQVKANVRALLDEVEALPRGARGKALRTALGMARTLRRNRHLTVDQFKWIRQQIMGELETVETKGPAAMRRAMTRMRRQVNLLTGAVDTGLISLDEYIRKTGDLLGLPPVPLNRTPRLRRDPRTPTQRMGLPDISGFLPGRQPGRRRMGRPGSGLPTGLPEQSRVERTGRGIGIAHDKVQAKFADTGKKAEDMSKKGRAAFTELETKGGRHLTDLRVKFKTETDSMNRITERGFGSIVAKMNRSLATIGGAAGTGGPGGTGGGHPSTAAGATGMRIKHAAGGRIPGRGLQDTVPIAPGHIAAPGELVVNRHTEQAHDRDARMLGLPSLDQRVRREKRRHSDPLRGGREYGAAYGMRLQHGGRVHGVQDLTALGNWMRGLGYTVGENASLGDSPLPGVHSATGYHYMFGNSGAIDVNADSMAGGEKANLDRLAGILSRRGWHYLWQVADHFDHLHVDLAGGGGSVGGLPAMRTPRLRMPHAYAGGRGLRGQASEQSLRRVRRAAQRRLNREFGDINLSGFSGGGSNTANMRLGKRMMLAMGFGADQWPALRTLWQGESGWSHTIANASSGALGIPQALPGSKMASEGADYRTNPATQIAWGLKYIKGRYGTPSGALASWNARSPHWYEEGGRIPWFRGGGDFIATRPQVIGVGDGGRERVTVSRGGGGGGRGGPLIGSLTVNSHRDGDVRTAVVREVRQALRELKRELAEAGVEDGDLT